MMTLKLPPEAAGINGVGDRDSISEKEFFEAACTCWTDPGMVPYCWAWQVYVAT